MYNKKAQISEGLTWVVATIAIIVVLLFSVFISSFFFSKVDQTRNNFFSSNINQKSLLSYLLTKESNGKTIYSEIQSQEKINNVNGNLALKVFKNLYNNDYLEIWFGISDLGEGALLSSLNGRDNEFFGEKPSLTGSGAFGAVASKEADFSILKFADKKFLEVIFIK